MAGGARLNASRRIRFAGLAALVLLLHMVAMDWFARELEHPSLLQPIAPPMFTRLLQPQAPAAPPPPPAAIHATPRRPAITSVAKAPAVPRPAPAASAPQPPTTPAPPSEDTAPVAQAVASTPAAIEPAALAAMPASAPASAPVQSAAEPGLDSWPVDTRLHYRLGGNYRGELHGSARVQWQRVQDRYQARVEIDVTLLASLVLTSQGDVTPEALVPRVYEELRRGGPRGVRMGENNVMLNDGRSLPRPAGVQDTASQFVELSHRFASGREPLQVGRSVQLWLARPGGLDLWTYDIVEREILQTPELGAIEAFHLKPRAIANPRGNITAEMWFAPSLQYLPVRIRVNMGQDVFVDLMVEKIEQR